MRKREIIFATAMDLLQKPRHGGVFNGLSPARLKRALCTTKKRASARFVVLVVSAGNGAYR